MALPPEIEVVDPAHPLFGRRFRLLSACGPAHSAARLRVAYGAALSLTLPTAATDLAPRPPGAGTPCKLSAEALRDLLTVAEEAVAPCPSSPASSGPACRRGSVGRSLKTSPRRSGR